MSQIEKKFRYRNFVVYQDTRNIIIRISKIVEDYFPRFEKFSLSDQLHRAIYSVLLNIAEGADRESDKDFARFLNIAHGSLNEVVACFDIAKDKGYVKDSIHVSILNELYQIANQLTALRKSVLLKKY